MTEYCTRKTSDILIRLNSTLIVFSANEQMLACLNDKLRE